MLPCLVSGGCKVLGGVQWALTRQSGFQYLGLLLFFTCDPGWDGATPNETGLQSQGSLQFTAPARITDGSCGLKGPFTYSGCASLAPIPGPEALLTLSHALVKSKINTN